jgi:peroxiredoxin
MKKLVLLALIVLATAALANPELMEGKKAPNFTVKDVDGNSISLKDYEGKTLILNFWATW